jgi:uncharacterized membrane protein
MESKTMPEELVQSLQLVELLLEIIGASALIIGFVITTARFIFRYFREGATTAMPRYRESIGRVIMIGLEILVAATIIKTITLYPDVKGIGLLAFMIAIRVILGWTTTLEMYGRWPWQKP